MCYEKRQIYNNTFLEYLSVEITGFKFCYPDGSKGSGTDIAVGMVCIFQIQSLVVHIDYTLIIL